MGAGKVMLLDMAPYRLEFAQEIGMDAAIHVAHAFTVHAEHTETDYFAAVDDLLGGRDDEAQLGSGHIGAG